jgi:hypothetical protein
VDLEELTQQMQDLHQQVAEVTAAAPEPTSPAANAPLVAQAQFVSSGDQEDHFQIMQHEIS